MATATAQMQQQQQHFFNQMQMASFGAPPVGYGGKGGKGAGCGAGGFGAALGGLFGGGGIGGGGGLGAAAGPPPAAEFRPENEAIPQDEAQGKLLQLGLADNVVATLTDDKNAKDLAAQFSRYTTSPAISQILIQEGLDDTGSKDTKLRRWFSVK